MNSVMIQWLRYFCHELLLSLQIGITPRSFATDGVTWHATLGYGFKWTDPWKIQPKRVFLLTLNQLFLLQGLLSYSETVNYVLWRLDLSYSFQAWWHNSDCTWWQLRCLQYTNTKTSLLGMYRLNFDHLTMWCNLYLHGRVCHGYSIG